MDSETKDTLKKVAEYTAHEKKNLKKKMIDMMAGSVLLIAFCSVLFETNAFNGSIPESAYRNIMSFTLGLTLATMVLNILYLMGAFDKINEWKKSLKKDAR